MAKITESIKVNSVVLGNRIVMPPMATGKAIGEGMISEELVNYYKERAIGGYYGLIITEHAYIDKLGIASKNQVSISKDEDIEGYKKIADAIHSVGSSKVFAQINHCGISKDKNSPGHAVGPSPINKPWKIGLEAPIELTKEAISDIVNKFALAAVRARKACCDGVEIHVAHGNLLNQFYSPITNIRTDEYGGSVENRLRITKEVINAVRNAVGNDFPISVRLGGIDYYEGGNTLQECEVACRLLESYGVDLISLTGGMKGYTREGHNEAGYFKEMSLAAKKIVNVPVILTGGVKTAREAEELLEEGACDLVGVGRATLLDALWAKKAIEQYR